MKVLDIDGLEYYDGKIKETYATKTYVNTQDALKAPLASPALTGTPTAPTPTANDNSTKLATTAYVQAELTDYVTINGLSTELADYLPLSGGTMTGAIEFYPQGGVGFMGTAHTDPTITLKQTVVSAGDVDGVWNDGNAKLALHTFDETGTNPGENGAFVLLATDGTNKAELEGNPDGTLSWEGGIRFNTTLYGSANNNNKIVMIGNSQENKDGYTAVYGGEVQDDGANLYVYGKNHTQAGRFSLSAYDGTTRRSLVGMADGTLTWSGKNVEQLTALSGGTSGYVRYENGFQILWGQNGATQDGTTITFSTPFTENPRIMVCPTGYNISGGYGSVTKTSFKLTSSHSSSATVGWIAMGKWA